jgi:hypothetical protein
MGPIDELSRYLGADEGSRSVAGVVEVGRIGVVGVIV